MLDRLAYRRVSRFEYIDGLPLCASEELSQSDSRIGPLLYLRNCQTSTHASAGFRASVGRSFVPRKVRSSRSGCLLAFETVPLVMITTLFEVRQFDRSNRVLGSESLTSDDLFVDGRKSHT